MDESFPAPTMRDGGNGMTYRPMEALPALENQPLEIESPLNRW
jgi:hypothetical protein